MNDSRLEAFEKFIEQDNNKAPQPAQKIERGKKAENALNMVLNFGPVLVILVFGMVALHACVSLFEVQDRLYKSGGYEKFISSLFDIQAEYAAFESAFFHYNVDNQAEALNNVMEKLDVFNSAFSAYTTESYKYIGKSEGQKNAENYKNFLHVIQYDLLKLASDLNKIKSGETQASLSEETVGLENKIHNKLDHLHEGFMKKDSGEEPAREIKIRQSTLYWSIIAMALTGFLLAILNGSKLQALHKANKDKQNNLATLKSHLAALESARDGIIIIDSNGSLSYINKAMAIMHGLSTNEADRMVGGDWRNIYSDSDLYLLEENIIPELRSKGYWRGDFVMTNMRGDTVYTEMSLTSLPDGGFIGTTQDVTEQRKSESEKKDLEAQFYQAQKMEAIGQLAGGVAHDFNNILAAMLGYAEFLEEDLEEGTSHKRFASNIIKAGHQAKELVEQILAFSRRSSTEKQRMNILDAVDETVSMLRASLPKTIEIETNVALKEAPIDANPTQIAQLIMNLCVNARDAMDDSHGTLEIDVDEVYSDEFPFPQAIDLDLPDPKGVPPVYLEDGEAGQTILVLNHVAKGYKYIHLRVKDSGTGMSRIIMERIFEPFFTTKPVDKGTGLGLATVHGVIAGHSGAMIVDSTLGKGTSFDLYFLKSDEIENRKKEEEYIIETRTNKNKAKILLVEDQEDVRDMTLCMLERLGYEAESCESGIQGLEIIREKGREFDLVVTDHNMPKMTGLEMIRQAHLECPDLPFIVLSGYAQEKLEAISKSHEAVKFVLRKPIKADELKRIIETVLSSAKAA